MEEKVSILLIDGSWLEGTKVDKNRAGITLKDVSRSRDGLSGTIPIEGKKVDVPRTSILFTVTN
jgi:hypothetical protein